MKPRSISCLVALASALLTLPSGAQEAWTAESLSPEDLGMSKYMFAMQAPEGSVVVFRREKYINDRLVARYETISATSTEKHTESVLVINWSILKGKNDVTLQQKGGNELLNSVTLNSSMWRRFPDPLLKLVYEGREKGIMQTFLYSMFTEPYAEVSKRTKGLLPLSARPWTFARADDIPGE